MEKWKSIAGYEGLYEVSNLGRVRSLKFGKTKILTPKNNGIGYFQVGLRKDGISKYLLVHRLVANAFIPNPQNLKTVNHIDEDKSNNNVSNLEWMSQTDNINYGTRTARCSKQVQKFDKQTGALLATFQAAREAERRTGIAQSSICACCKDRLKSAGGYVWRYS